MPNEPMFRKMTEADWEAFHAFDRSAFPDDSMSEEFFFRRLERDGFYSLDVGEEIVGQLIIAPFGENEGHLGRIAIAPTHQGKGYGKYLMRKAMELFKEQGYRRVHLYTQDHNTIAQGLYKQFGFEKSGTSWHYFVPLDTLSPSGEYHCQPVQENEIDSVGERYESLPSLQIRRLLEFPENPVLILKDSEGNLKGACRFTPSFPGCFPFEVDEPGGFDDFIFGLTPYTLPDFDYVRVTFVNNEKLAIICNQRGYKLHHRLYKMTAEI
ncbi:MAG: GNAT family N-acetyltransferase [Candidatus Thorarchaeota archaeon]|nr:GNAT family N-acetyltransferase [Candidatus Thorarchaeota archaeon]